MSNSEGVGTSLRPPSRRTRLHGIISVNKLEPGEASDLDDRPKSAEYGVLRVDDQGPGSYQLSPMVLRKNALAQQQMEHQRVRKTLQQLKVHSRSMINLLAKSPETAQRHLLLAQNVRPRSISADRDPPPVRPSRQGEYPPDLRGMLHPSSRARRTTTLSRGVLRRSFPPVEPQDPLSLSAAGQRARNSGMPPVQRGDNARPHSRGGETSSRRSSQKTVALPSLFHNTTTDTLHGSSSDEQQQQQHYGEQQQPQQQQQQQQQQRRSRASVAASLGVRRSRNSVDQFLMDPMSGSHHLRDAEFKASARLTPFNIKELLLKKMHVPPNVAAIEDEDADNAAFMNFVISLAIHGRQLMMTQPDPKFTSSPVERKPSPKPRADRQMCKFCVSIRVGGGYVFVGFANEAGRCIGCGRFLDFDLSDPTQASMVNWAVQFARHRRRQKGRRGGNKGGDRGAGGGDGADVDGNGRGDGRRGRGSRGGDGGDDGDADHAVRLERERRMAWHSRQGGGDGRGDGNNGRGGSGRGSFDNGSGPGAHGRGGAGGGGGAGFGDDGGSGSGGRSGALGDGPGLRGPGYGGRGKHGADGDDADDDDDAAELGGGGRSRRGGLFDDGGADSNSGFDGGSGPGRGSRRHRRKHGDGGGGHGRNGGSGGGGGDDNSIGVVEDVRAEGEPARRESDVLFMQLGAGEHVTATPSKQQQGNEDEEARLGARSSFAVKGKDRRGSLKSVRRKSTHRKMSEIGGTDPMLEQAEEEAEDGPRADGAADDQRAADKKRRHKLPPTVEPDPSGAAQTLSEMIKGDDHDDKLLDEEAAASDAIKYAYNYCILDPDRVKYYLKVFKDVDTNKDHRLDHKELGRGLRHVNNHLITNREVDYVLRVLDVVNESMGKGRRENKRRISFRLFSVIAALSERVTKLDTAVRKKINTMDYRALEEKLKLARHLFYVNDIRKAGTINMEALEIEMQAGNLKSHHRKEVMDQIAKEGIEEMTFLDYLAYIPLFLDIHDAILDNPLDDSRNRDFSSYNPTFSGL